MSKEEQQSLLLASVSARNDTGSPMFPLFPITPWQRRDVILFILESLGWVLFSVTFSFLFVLPLCGMIFRCDCIWEWDTSEKCTVMMRRETCPFCGRGNGGIVSTSLIPQWGVVPLMVGAALLMRYKKPNMYLARFIVVIVVFFVFVIGASVIFELVSGYPHFM